MRVNVTKLRSTAESRHVPAQVAVPRKVVRSIRMIARVPPHARLTAPPNQLSAMDMEAPSAGFEPMVTVDPPERTRRSTRDEPNERKAA